MLTRPHPVGAPAPRVSVVVPCFNYGRYLPDCVASILSQQGVQPDVLIMDDASTDDSASVALALAEANPNVHVIQHRENKGHIATYNEGLGIIEGEFAVLISADDLLAPGALGRATALMRHHPEVGLVYGRPVIFTGHETPTSVKTRTTSWSVWRGAAWAELQCRRGSSLIYSPEAVVRTSVQRSVGDYSPDLPHSGDLEMWLRFAAVSDIGRINGPDQALKRTHGSNMITVHYGTVLADLSERWKAYQHFFLGSGGSLVHADRMLETAAHRVGLQALEAACDEMLLKDPNREVVSSLIEFAAVLDPAHDQQAIARELQGRMQGGEPNSLSRAGMAILALRRDLRRRLRWHRWSALGT